MLDRNSHLSHCLYVYLSIQNIITQINGFICPRDGRWPHPSDCEKYFTCDSGVSIEVWCGNGMTYDVENERCDLSKHSECKNGERPNWTPPEGWQAGSVTHIPSTRATTMLFDDQIDDDRKSKTIYNLTRLISSSLAYSRMLLPAHSLVENSRCTFQGNVRDQADCQSYFACKDELITRFQCPDKHLFDDDLRSCNDYRKVFCANRPTRGHGNEPCVGQPNGWYAEYGNQCRSYYLCTEQRKTKTGECPLGSKWNLHRLQCDDPRYIAAPCGLRDNHSRSLFGHHSYSATTTTTAWILLFCIDLILTDC